MINFVMRFRKSDKEYSLSLAMKGDLPRLTEGAKYNIAKQLKSHFTVFEIMFGSVRLHERFS